MTGMDVRGGEGWVGGVSLLGMGIWSGRRFERAEALLRWCHQRKGHANTVDYSHRQASKQLSCHHAASCSNPCVPTRLCTRSMVSRRVAIC